MNEAKALSESSRGAMIAAAGCGKTEVIATAVGRYGQRRELILTHTHAGVEAIRRRLNKFQVPAGTYQISTIAGWALRLAAAFPRTSELPTPKPRIDSEYAAVCPAAARLLALQPIQEIVRASYSGVYIDEYQDCTLEQHGFVIELMKSLPCRIVGDPLQGIFDFGDNKPIRWEEHVAPSFEEMSGPTKPWRWATLNPRLGVWLQDVRGKLQEGRPIELRGAPVKWLDGSSPESKLQNQLSACFARARDDDRTVIAIHQWQRQCHSLASKLKGVYSCVEAIDTSDLYQFADRLDTTSGFGRAVAVLDFAGKCMTKVRTELRTIRRALEKGREPKIRRHSACLKALVSVVKDTSVAAIEPALRILAELSGAFVFRRELLQEMVRAVRLVSGGEVETLTEAAWLVRNQARQHGRLISRCAVGTTLLVKGLEFDHAVVLDADAFDTRNLYVALTRGSKSLTIVSRSRTIRPQESSSSTD